MLGANQLLRNLRVHTRCSAIKKTLTCPAALSTQRRFVSTSSKSPGFFKSTWGKYERLLESHPIATKVGTACGIAAAGDINCQVFIEKDNLSLKRVAVFTFLGGIMVPPILHVWYKFLGRFASGITTQAILKRLALDQLGFAPVFLPIFFSTLLTLEGVPEMIPSKLEQDWWPAVKANWVVWVPAQFINFRFVPGHLQVLFANVMGLFWNSYLSYISHAITDEIAFETASHEAGIVITEQEESVLTA